MPQGSTVAITDTSRAIMAALEFCQIPGIRGSWQSETYHRLQLLAARFRPTLTKAQQWDVAVQKLVRLPQGWLLVSTLLRESAIVRSSVGVQKILASSLVETLKLCEPAARDSIMPALRKLVEDAAWTSLHDDLKTAITAWYCRFEPDDQLPEPIILLRDSFRSEDLMSDEGDLQAAFQQLSIAPRCFGRQTRLRKRRKILVDATDDRTVSAGDVQSQRDQLCRRLGRLLTGVDNPDTSVLPEIAPSVYATLTEQDQCVAWQCLIDLPQYDLPAALETVTRLIQQQTHHGTSRARVLSMLAVRECVQRADDSQHVALATSLLGRHCIQSLRSSIRELRLAAGQTIACFLRDSLPDEVRSQNRQLALEYLRSASERDVDSEQETLISAWGQIAISCGDKELNLVLLRLVEYLGHHNAFVCALAFSEIEAIATFKGLGSHELFRPFWRSIAVAVVQDLHSRPQKAQQLCDLLQVDIRRFLVMTQRETLPFLVLTRKKDTIKRIADAQEHGDFTNEDVIMQPRTNLASILALLLSQSSHEAEDLAFNCLTEVAPGLGDTDISNLVKVDPVLVAAEMLKLCGEQSDDRKSRAFQAFQTFANIAERLPGQRKAHAKSSKAVASFFEDKMLGILTLFSTQLESGPTGESVQEKIRCLKAMADMFFIGRSKLSSALPQIRACLQSGLEQAELCEVAFDAWLTLMPVLEGDDVALMVDETFVLIARHWSVLSPEVQRKTHDMLAQLVKSHNAMLQEQIMTLPSLEGIPLLSKFAAEFERLRAQESVESRCKALANRLRDDSDTVVLQSVVELTAFLEEQQDFIHDTAASEHPSPVLSALLSALLDVTVKYASTHPDTAELCGKALGIIGCLDPNRVEATRKKSTILVLSNFDRASEVIHWVVALFERVLVKAFRSVTNAKSQGFLAYTMQELLTFCDFRQASTMQTRASQAPDALTKWQEMPEHVRTTLTPLLTSRYVITSNNAVTAPERAYPGYNPDTSHSQWLKSITYDLMFKGKGDNAKAIFSLLARIIRGQDISIARFVFPYAVLNVVIGGTHREIQDLVDEFMVVLKSLTDTALQEESVRLCSESVFAVLDYMSTWLREKRKELSDTRIAAYKTGVSPSEFDEARDMGQIETVEKFLGSIPAEIIAKQAMNCRSYARALFHWEQYIRQVRSLIPGPKMQDEETEMYDRLQDIYTQIDEPDGLEGIAAHLPIVSEQQRAINHAKAGRWSAAQAWYELSLNAYCDDTGLQHELLSCLRETGQFAPLLRYTDSFANVEHVDSTKPRDIKVAVEAHLPLAVEASWMTEEFSALEAKLRICPSDLDNNFNVGVGRALLYARSSHEDARTEISKLRKNIAEGLSMASTDSLHACHEQVVKLHVLYELEALSEAEASNASQLLRTFDKRLNAVGAFIQDKQYILGVRRAAMSLKPSVFKEKYAGPSWLTTARLARQSKNISSAYNAVLKAQDRGDRGAKVEEARLLWHEGHQRQAIQALEGAIQSGMLDDIDMDSSSTMDVTVSATTSSTFAEIHGWKQNPLLGKALLLLAKWLDASGQSQTKDMTDRYQSAARRHQRWEKGHYYLGKHYSKLLDAQKNLPREKQHQNFLSGELTKLIIDNSLRSIPFGNKYWHETIPRIITLWLQLGMDAHKKARGDDDAMFDRRVKALQGCNRQLQKYFERVPPYVFYHALPQLISRITHPHPEVWKQLCNILTRIASAHPSQTLWSLLAVVKASDKVRVERGIEVLNRLKDPKNKSKQDSSVDLRATIAQGQKLCDGLLLACEQAIEPRAVQVSLSRNLHFNHKLAPSNLVVPVEATLTASSPPVASSESIRRHKAFTQDRICIHAFLDDVLVLNSLQRPRKITVRGTDGKLYGLLCKPKDDLRKDQRLMEFNGIINRALKRNTESSKRRLYIKTYAVTPLSEESGSIEWVEGIKPMRDILLSLYGRKGVRPNYNEIKKSLDLASSGTEHVHVFADQVLSQFAPSLHEWFMETYPEPEMWFNARVRYARSAAVMSMVGHILGLGDRHGENILLEESTGGVFHVDFNCLFDKGLTFEKPELVPFRLTHNMVDAMGPYGYEGPFRKSSELTLGLLRQEKDTLMTVLQTFLYDPTTDFVQLGKKKGHKNKAGVPETPEEILESVGTKLKGLLKNETVPLSVEGYVDALCQMATSHFNLASMYIGWCSFL